MSLNVFLEVFTRQGGDIACEIAKRGRTVQRNSSEISVAR